MMPACLVCRPHMRVARSLAPHAVQGARTLTPQPQLVQGATTHSNPVAAPLSRTMASWDDNNRLEVLRNSALLPTADRPLERQLLEVIPNDVQHVMIGEASHGTEEFYKTRAELTKLLIKERGFNAVVVEADFPDAFRVGMYVRGLSADGSAEEALADFTRFPTWMWRNTVVTEFVEWLRCHNAGLPPDQHYARSVGFAGMDVYSLHASAAHVVQYLSQVDPEAASRVKARYKCFDRYGADTMAYAYAVGMAGAPSCANAALATLKDIGRKVNAYSAKLDGEKGEELAFAAHCNAAVVKGAEAYYANMFFGEELTWNLRDHHFLDTVKSLRSHLTRRVPGPKLILWAHNSHLGDASATDMGQRRGEINIGQLMRQEFGAKAVFNIGFTTHTGTVSAADDWDTPVQLKAVRKSMPGSYEHLFHRAGMPEFVLDLRGGSPDLRAALEGPLLERAVGVIYRPVTERQSHYFSASLSRQFDAVVHLDTTSALHPLEKTGAWERDWRAREDAPETYPFAV